MPWELTACILTLARFCGQKNELEVAQRWYADSALEDLLGVPFSQINDTRLYRGLDVLHAHKDELYALLQQRYQSWFGVQFEFLLYDLTSTYFEVQAHSNASWCLVGRRPVHSSRSKAAIAYVETPGTGLFLPFLEFGSLAGGDRPIQEGFDQRPRSAG